MNPLLELFPESVWIDGKEYAIRSGFRTVLKINNIVGEEKKRLSSEEVEEMLLLFYPIVPENIPEAIQKLLEFLECGKENGKKKVFPKKAAGLNGKKGMDLDTDAQEIYAAFYQQYGIDLSEDMHWWKFNILLGCLSPDTHLAKIIEFRTIDTKNKNLSKEERKYYEAMQRYYALSENLEMDEKARAIEDALMRGEDISNLLEDYGEKD